MFYFLYMYPLTELIRLAVFSSLKLNLSFSDFADITKGRCEKVKPTVKRCGACFSLCHRGKPHVCNSKTRLNNLKSFINESSPLLKEKIASSLIKEKIKDEKTSSRSALVTFSTCNNRSVKVALNPKKSTISADDMQKMQSSFQLSQKAIIGIGSMLRVAAKDRKIVESGLKGKLSKTIHQVDNFFESKSFEFKHMKGKEISDVSQTTVYCKNVEGLIQFVKDKRGVSDAHLKLGLDGGGGFLKLCLSIQSEDQPESADRKRQKFEDGVAAKRFKDSGVKKLIILALVQSCQENYENVNLLFSAVNISNLGATFAVDLKMANILAGIMSHSSMYPCTWCDAAQHQLGEAAVLRTIGSIIDNYNKWKDAGAVKDNAKHFMNCIHEPLLKGDQDTLILDIIPPPELHLLIGVVNTLFERMQKDFNDTALKWAASCNVARQVIHGGSGFNGNASKKLLDKVDDLRSICEMDCLKYVRVFQDFGKVVRACFSDDLDPNYKEYINDFRNAYSDLQIKKSKVTPKVHAVFFHVPEFCDKHKIGLKKFSEQAMETVHTDFKPFVKRAVGPNHSEYAKYLLDAVCAYNGLHVV